MFTWKCFACALCADDETVHVMHSVLTLRTQRLPICSGRDIRHVGTV